MSHLRTLVDNALAAQARHTEAGFIYCGATADTFAAAKAAERKSWDELRAAKENLRDAVHETTGLSVDELALICRG